MSKFDEWRKKTGEVNNLMPKSLYVQEYDEYPTNVASDGATIKRANWAPDELLKLRDWITENFDN